MQDDVLFGGKAEDLKLVIAGRTRRNAGVNDLKLKRANKKRRRQMSNMECGGKRSGRDTALVFPIRHKKRFCRGGHTPYNPVLVPF
ncbi:MAG: hypothetical protein PHD76_13035 [Methylacidiphilales bacterium]|nr:hypothetical protein [Candidatus Methylacidiphilales bacterium]